MPQAGGHAVIDISRLAPQNRKQLYIGLVVVKSDFRNVHVFCVTLGLIDIFVYAELEVVFCCETVKHYEKWIIRVCVLCGYVCMYTCMHIVHVIYIYI